MSWFARLITEILEIVTIFFPFLVHFWYIFAAHFERLVLRAQEDSRAVLRICLRPSWEKTIFSKQNLNFEHFSRTIHFWEHVIPTTIQIIDILRSTRLPHGHIRTPSKHDQSEFAVPVPRTTIFMLPQTHRSRNALVKKNSRNCFIGL